MNPNRVTHWDLHPSARAIGNSFVTALDLQRIVGDFRNRNHVARAERTGETRSYVTSITYDGYVIVISDFFGFGAANHEIVKRVINGFRDKVALLPGRVAAERIGHRA